MCLIRVILKSQRRPTMIDLLQSFGWGGEAIAILTAVVTIASAVANITPTQKDDEVISKAKRWLSILGLEFRR